MRYLPILATAPLVMSATPPAAIVSQPAYSERARAWPGVADADRHSDCDRKIEQARAEAGKPRIERGPADATKPILHYAVDRRIDGCDVLVPVGSPGEFLPVPQAGPPAILPAKPGR